MAPISKPPESIPTGSNNQPGKLRRLWSSVFGTRHDTLELPAALKPQEKTTPVSPADHFTNEVSKILGKDASLTQKLIGLIKLGAVSRIIIAGATCDPAHISILHEHYEKHPMRPFFSDKVELSQGADYFVYTKDGSDPKSNMGWYCVPIQPPSKSTLDRHYASKTLNWRLLQFNHMGEPRNAAYVLLTDSLSSSRYVNMSTGEPNHATELECGKDELILRARMPLSRREYGTGRHGESWSILLIAKKEAAEHLFSSLQTPGKIYSFFSELIPGMREIDGDYSQGAFSPMKLVSMKYLGGMLETLHRDDIRGLRD
ncbi:Uncharacterised protein [Candidatus Anstonella stagnisolia]|nr:Uncharacterised protein [Candidatus Anstonella stagnisolia]